MKVVSMKIEWKSTYLLAADVLVNFATFTVMAGIIYDNHYKHLWNKNTYINPLYLFQTLLLQLSLHFIENVC